jgi:hypothetical protein
LKDAYSRPNLANKSPKSKKEYLSCNPTAKVRAQRIGDDAMSGGIPVAVGSVKEAVVSALFMPVKGRL